MTIGHRHEACSDGFTTPLPTMPPLIPQAEMEARINEIRRAEQQEDCPTCGGSGKRTPRRTRR